MDDHHPRGALLRGSVPHDGESGDVELILVALHRQHPFRVRCRGTPASVMILGGARAPFRRVSCARSHWCPRRCARPARPARGNSS
ncbi:hypothetical protein ACFFX0_20435 [Citricoccus parietis]|uniref:Uncharacterized protein n=1 Tax=Citricoccus parietis TaxID=592307 RepID=A0ABV5G3C5_9MICC